MTMELLSYKKTLVQNYADVRRRLWGETRQARLQPPAMKPPAPLVPHTIRRKCYIFIPAKSVPLIADLPESLRPIAHVVCSAFQVTLADINGASRLSHHVASRHVMFYLVQVITGKNRCEIGRRFGGRDHTTVLHAIRKITRKVVVDPEFAQMVAGLRAQIAARVG